MLRVVGRGFGKKRTSWFARLVGGQDGGSYPSIRVDPRSYFGDCRNFLDCTYFQDLGMQCIGSNRVVVGRSCDFFDEEDYGTCAE